MINLWNWLSDPYLSPYGGPIMQNALWELLLISVASGVIGTFIVLRGLVFIVDALTHAIFPGVVIAFLLGLNFFAGAFMAGIIVTLLIGLAARNQQVSEDSAIGVIFTGAFALGVVLLSSIKSYGRSLEDFLFGDILGIGASDLLVTFLLATVVLLIIFAFRKELVLTSFDGIMARAMGLPVARLDLLLYLLIALTVVISLPSIGNILVLGFLVTPAATARLFTNRLYTLLLASIGFGMLSSVVGLSLGYYANLAGSAGVIVVATAFFVIGLIVSPRYGLIKKLLQQRRLHQSRLEAQI